jgi:hypothetical protein
MSVKESRYNVIQAYQDAAAARPDRAAPRLAAARGAPAGESRPRLGRLLALVGDHLRASPGDPHRILAELGASVYVTTNFDPLLERALKANERAPQQVLTRWRHQKTPAAADEPRVAVPTAKAPLVYHVFGAFGADTDEGLVLTENDYFDYLITTAAAS